MGVRRYLTTTCIGVIIFCSFDATAFDLFQTKSPSFIFALGTNIDSITSDVRAKSCKDAGTLNINDELADGYRQFNCTGIENTSGLKLVFYAEKLVWIRAQFASLDKGEIGRQRATIDINGDESERGLLKALQGKCGTITSKHETSKISEDRALSGDAIRFYLDSTITDNYVCAPAYYELTPPPQSTRHPILQVNSFDLVDRINESRGKIHQQKKQQEKVNAAASKFNF